MLELEKFETLEDKIFLLNKDALDEILSYSLREFDNMPVFFKDFDLDGKEKYVVLAEGGIDEEGNAFPDTYIAFGPTSEEEAVCMISGIYADDISYKAPKNGINILLKKNTVKKI